MLWITQESSFTTEVLDAITTFADGNVYVAFTVLVTLLSGGLLYAAIKKEKIDGKFFPLLWFFLITNFIFCATISMITLPLKEEAETVINDYENLRITITDLEGLVETYGKNVNKLLEENNDLRKQLIEAHTQTHKKSKKRKSSKGSPTASIQIPKEPKLLKTERSLSEIKREIIQIDSLHYRKRMVNPKKIKP